MLPVLPSQVLCTWTPDSTPLSLSRTPFHPVINFSLLMESFPLTYIISSPLFKKNRLQQHSIFLVPFAAQLLKGVISNFFPPPTFCICLYTLILFLYLKTILKKTKMVIKYDDSFFLKRKYDFRYLYLLTYF